jgi:two-component system NtrC family sensor kinase
MTEPSASVLVIEDEPSVMAFVRAALERNGYQVHSAVTGALALQMLQQHGYAGVISDMRTPGGVDGADVWEWISQNRPELLAKVIFITGDIVNEDTARTLQRTGAPYIEKPFRVSELLAVVRRVLENAK